jgi:hypothetical protein
MELKDFLERLSRSYTKYLENVEGAGYECKLLSFVQVADYQEIRTMILC